MPVEVLLLAILTSVLFPFDFSYLYIRSFGYYFFQQLFFINEGSTVIGYAAVVSLPNNFHSFMYKDCILVRRS